MKHNWYSRENGEPKTHHRAHTCEQCREYPKGGCALPFRKQLKVRWLAALDKKPHLGLAVKWRKLVLTMQKGPRNA
jgi:hypothetical protein